MNERNSYLLSKKFRAYLISTIAATTAMFLATVIDSVIVGNLVGDKALAAIGLAAPVIFTLDTLCLLFAVGGITCAAIAGGQQNAEKANRFFTLTLALGLGALFVFLCVLLIFMGPITTTLSSGDAEMKELLTQYLTPFVFLGMPLFFANALVSFVRTDGYPKYSAIIPTVSVVVNVVLDLVLINAGMGIFGAGLSTTLAYVASSCVALPYLFFKNRTFRFSIPKVDFFAHVKEIISAGASGALMPFTSFLRALVLNLLIMKYLGSSGMTAMAVCINAFVIANIFVLGTTDTALPILGTLHGERDIFGIKNMFRLAAVTVVALCTIVAAFFIITPATVSGWFGVAIGEGAEVVTLAIRLFALHIPFLGINQLLRVFYTVTEREGFASAIAVAEGFLFTCTFALILTPINTDFIWLSFVLGEVATLVALLITALYLKKKEKLKSLLLLNETNESIARWDLTIPATTDVAVNLSEKIIAFCKEHNVESTLSMRLGIAAEEMVVNIAKHGHNGKAKGVIDLMLTIFASEIVLRLRDDGKPFDPVSFAPEVEDNGGIQIVKKLATNINYSQQLGFNTCVITLLR